MMDDWSISSRDLVLVIDAGRGRREGLEHGLREAIRAGRLASGTRLPSTRALARDLGFARGTVADAYAQLVAEGYLAARQGSGTVVATGVAASEDLPERRPAGTSPRFDFRPGTPDLSSFPRSLWLAALRRVLATAPDDVFGYGDPRGREELRRALAAYLGRARGVRTTPELILVCSGFAQGLGLLCAALRSFGVAVIALEDPGLPDHRAIVRAAGLTMAALAVDAEGPRLEALTESGAGAVVVTPAHQSMMGVTASPPRRAGLVRWARAAGALVIEDDYDGEFRYDRQPLGAVQGLDPECVVYAGTASKTLAPGLRLAWLAVPPRLLEPLMEAKRLADRHTGALDQLVLADLIESGRFDRHVRRMRLEYRRRRDLLMAALAERVPALRPTGIAAGLHVVLPLPPGGPSEAKVVAHAARRGVAIHGLSRYRHEPGPHSPAIVVGYGALPQHAFPAALAALTDALAELLTPKR